MPSVHDSRCRCGCHASTGADSGRRCPNRGSVKLADTASPEDKAAQELISLVSTSVGAREFPETNPSVEDPAAWMPEEMEKSSECLNPSDLSDTSACTYGQGDKLAIVVGDSVAASWVLPVAQALGPKGYKVHGVGLSDCPFAHMEIALKDNPQRAAACNTSKGAIEAQISELQPDLLITTDFEGSITRLASGSVAHSWSATYSHVGTTFTSQSNTPLSWGRLSDRC